MKSDELQALKLMGDDELSRIGISVPASLLEQFNRLIEKKGYANRSEAFRDLIRDALIEDTVENLSEEVVATLTLVYDRAVRLLSGRLLEMQHDHFEQIISTIQVHLDHENCLEVVILRGNARDIQEVADSLIATKGVRHGRLVLTTAARGGLSSRC